MPFDIIKKFGKGENKIENQVEPVIMELCESLLSVIRRRRSIRKYLKKDIPDFLLERILESTRYTPSAGNYQPWEFIVVKNDETKKDLVAASYDQKWMLEANIFIVACINIRLAGAVYGERGARLYGPQAVSCAIENMLLTAESLGLGTCWVGAFTEVVVSRVLECPEYVRPCAIITLGYPNEEPPMPPRQSIQEYVHIEKFGETLRMISVGKEKTPTYMKFR
jgi:nitroreductase